MGGFHVACNNFVASLMVHAMCYMLCATCYMSRLDSAGIDLYIDGTLLN